MFKKAEKSKQKLRLLLEGASGSGKTYSALELASGLGSNIAVIDTENGSASLYADKFEFDTLNLKPPFTPEKYIGAIELAEKDYDVLIIDSISHEWSGEGGCLDIHNSLGGKFQDWAKVTPKHKKFLDKIISSDVHIIATARTKTDYAMNVNERGKTSPTKIGMKSEQRDGLEYEFTTVLRINENHLAACSKDRTGVFDGKEQILSKENAKELIDWLNSGKDPDATKAQKTQIGELLEALGINSGDVEAMKEAILKRLPKYDGKLTQDQANYLIKKLQEEQTNG